ncbi:MAG: molybdopterin biosynthesis protein [Bacillota bacterium]|nr:molybdopterin biosynthesis protein [Bacillota bacterium]
MERNVYIENMPLEKALELFTQRLAEYGWYNIETEVIPTRESLGRITALPVHAKRSSPHYVASAMDGIAVKAKTTFGASETNPVYLSCEQYLELDTGDYVPAPFDAVIMIEDINRINDRVKIVKAAVPWQHIRSIGEDLVEQDMIVPSYTPIGPYEIASFVTANVETVTVTKRPVVGIIPTGTELVPDANRQLSPGQIVESNSHMLAGLCQQWGAIPLCNNIVTDDPVLIREAALNIKDRVDIVVICSGSSAGSEDYTSQIVEELGELLIHGIATRPGKPAILGIIDDKPVIGVPGYPISADLIFRLFVYPIIYQRLGKELPEPNSVKATLSQKLPSPMGVDEYVQVNVARIEDRFIAYPLNRGAGLSSVLVKSDGVIHIERGSEGLNMGESCPVIIHRSYKQIKNTLVCIGSHDMSIDFLIDLLQRRFQQKMISSNKGSMGGILALKRKETHIAGVHLLDESTGEYNIPYLEKYLPDEKWMLMNLVKRHQGLIIKKGNPQKIEGIHDLVRPCVRYINRQKGAGTRVLLDYLLKTEGLSPDEINGYNREEFTHLAVASSVKSDACDVGMGIYSAASVMGLDFIPIGIERYDLCILPELMGRQSLDNLLSIIHSQAFKQQLLSVGGYDLDLTGHIVHKHNC